MILIEQNIPRLRDALAGCGMPTDSFSGRELTNKDLIDSRCTHLFVRSTTKVDAQLLEGTRVAFVATATAGTDHLDWDYISRAGIHAVSAAGANANSVAEYPIFAALEHFKGRHSDLSSLKFGVIGYGYIGSRVAAYASAIGFQVFVNDSILKAAGLDLPPAISYGKIPHIFAECDVVTNHIPLSYDSAHPTAGWFDKFWLSRLKAGSLFVHSSRGRILIERDAIHAARSSKIAFAIDVWENEPDFNPILARESLLATPHIGAYSAQGKLGGAETVAREFEKFSGLTPDYAAFTIPEAPERIHPSEISPKELHSLLHQRRDFLGDTRRLLEAARLPDSERGKAFDELRRSYPVRHETLRLA